MTTVLGHRRRRREKLKQYTLESTPGVGGRSRNLL